MNYTLHQLRIFVKVCELQSITKASEVLFISQPAVSIQLKKLQEEFEIPLTEVIGRQLHVTNFGEQIRILVEEILEKTTLIEQARDEFKGILTGNIKIASASTGKYVIPYFLSEFMREHPGVNISIDVTNKTKVVAHLQENIIDFALVSVIPQNLSLVKIPLMDNELHLVAASNHPNLPTYMQRRSLSNYTLILREHGSATRNAMMNFLEENRIKVKRFIQLTSNEAVKQAVRAGLGLSIMPLIGIRSELKWGNMQVVPIKGLPIITQWNLVYGKGKRLSPAGEALIAHVEAQKKRIIELNFGTSVSDSSG
ncbi:MAG: LysR family transcriptional regulator [Bacteroidota bacterium]